MSTSPYTNKSVIPSDELANAVRELALEIGVAAAAKTLTISPATLGLIAARLPSHRSTHRLVSSVLNVPFSAGEGQ